MPARYNDPVMSVRNPLSAAICVLSILFAGAPAANRVTDEGQQERSLTFYHTHTEKWLTVTYAENGAYVDEALHEVSQFLGDFRSGHMAAMDPELFDVLYDLRQAVGSDGAYEVISAYRSPVTNEMLRQRSSGVARNSQHLKGTAIDVRLQGVDTAVLRDAAIELQRGGVGYYKSSDFVHIDTGRVRRW